MIDDTAIKKEIEQLERIKERDPERYPSTVAEAEQQRIQRKIA